MYSKGLGMGSWRALMGQIGKAQSTVARQFAASFIGAHSRSMRPIKLCKLIDSVDKVTLGVRGARYCK